MKRKEWKSKEKSISKHRFVPELETLQRDQLRQGLKIGHWVWE